MIDRRTVLGLFVGAACSVAFLWLTDIPLGIPGEWEWKRIPVEDGQMVAAGLGWVMAGSVAAVYCALAWLGVKRLEVCSRTETAVWLGSLVLAGFFWLGVVQESPPAAKYRLTKTPWVLYDWGASGYFHEARYKMHDVKSFLATYEAKMAEGDYYHVGTHPPGLFLLHRGLIRLCEQFPPLTHVLLQLQPRSVEDGFEVLDSTPRLHPPPLLKSDRAAIWLAAIVTQLVGVATLIPLYLLLRRDYSPQISWMAVTFWPLVPALAIFLPKSDALYPFLGTAFLYVWLTGWRRRSALLCLFSGLLFWLGMFFSLAVLPYALLAALMTVWEARLSVAAERPHDWFRATCVCVAWSTAGLLVAGFALWVAFDINLANVWAWNGRNHAAFYDHHPRTYWKWLGVNALELALAVGLPVLGLAASSFVRTLQPTRGWQQRHLGPFWGCAIVWGLLWLSGKNMGEAARLWLVIQPWLIWLTAGSFQRPLSQRSTPHTSPPLKTWLLILVLQAIACLATVTRVSGFDY